MLSGIFNSIYDIKINNIFNSIMNNSNHFKLYLLIQISLIISIFILVNIRNNSIYKSDLKKITDTISTPVRTGQGQFGTARWINEREFEKIFHKNGINLKNDIKGQKFDSGGIVVGYNKLKDRECIYYVDDNTHSVVVGATRSGKTRTIVLQTIANLGIAGESIIISDPKR